MKKQVPISIRPQKPAKWSVLEAWRFIFMLLIMAHHTYYLGTSGDFPFRFAWIYVEFFFMVSGYFTMRHFRTEEKDVRFAHESIIYTLKKFKEFIPYMILAIAAEYFLDSAFLLKEGKVLQFFSRFVNMPFEMLLLSATGIIRENMSPIWYLSAMLMTMPLLCYVIQRWRDLFTNILCWLIPVVYYGHVGVVCLRTWPHDMLRAFACMSLGCFVYVCAEHFSKLKPGKKFKLFLTAAELSCFLGTVWITCHYSLNGNWVLLLFFVGCTLMFSHTSYTLDFHCPLIDFLGKISMIMFLIHWPAATFVLKIASGISTRILLYYSLTIGFSIILYYGWNLAKGRMWKLLHTIVKK